MQTILNIFHKITYFHNLVYIYKDGSLEDGDQDLEDDNYLDPERDYDLINNLRRFGFYKMDAFLTLVMLC